MQNQLDTPGNKYVSTSDTINSSLPNCTSIFATNVSVPHESFTQDPCDLDIPIAIRKGTHSCTNQQMSKYLSCAKLSQSHKAFTSKISNLLVPRNIQEALDNPGCKIRSDRRDECCKEKWTWEIVN